jgi:hypothetical protein
VSAGVLEQLVEQALALRLPAVEAAMTERVLARVREEQRSDAPVEGQAAIAAVCREVGCPAGTPAIHAALSNGDLPAERIPKQQASANIPSFVFRCRRADVITWAKHRRSPSRAASPLP